MRGAVLAVVALAACGASVKPGGQADAPPPPPIDAPRPIDVAIDTPHACAGGDAHAGDGSTCYVWFAGPKIWVDARAACAALGGHLASIDSATHNTLAASILGGHDTFIGANDRALEGTFVWTDGSAVTYANWRTGEPSNGGGAYQEDCVVLEGAKVPPDTWDDRPCDATQVTTSGSFAYLCQL